MILRDFYSQVVLRPLQDEGLRQDTDLVNHSYINLQDVRNMYSCFGGCWKSQAKVMNHHLNHAWKDGRHLGKQQMKQLHFNTLF